jgi:hypothetical protein
MRAGSWKQRERQDRAHRERSGRYAKLNPCNACGRSAGADYESNDRCNEHDGFGLVLCARCGPKLAALSDAEFAELARQPR